MILHDLSKLSPSEFTPYANHFFGNSSKHFDEAWKHHYENNDHHIEYWKGEMVPIEALMEIIADWFAASLAYSHSWPIDGHWEWVEHHLATKEDVIHPVSFHFLCGLLVILGYEQSVLKALSVQHSTASSYDWEGTCSIINSSNAASGAKFRELFAFASLSS
eukprot:CAMPEP_0117038472 /NCGR_PEP_ID=MMETSP0472-20121206/27060_1 /TAXON_ID=693140 ORGANISM="Tiarina fusus, Strain LIS" /NCGR_SAMPLE_ID=MMETSP0472 /ASSEMBLY_ACC=CAM_ASM_000603 /LENGTH=161 /DNA_ID=CAMNT_0004748691 /DNA_START=144 /DNA_END=629 /DNA_ORIENTATION=-